MLTKDLGHHLPFTVDTEGFPGGSEGHESVCNAGDLCYTPGLWRHQRFLRQDPAIILLGLRVRVCPLDQRNFRWIEGGSGYVSACTLGHEG